MTRLKRQGVIIVLLLLVILISWNYHEQEYKQGNDKGLSLPGDELSTLPDEVYKSINEIEERAIEKKKMVKEITGFRLKAISLSTNQYIEENIPLHIQVYYSGSNQLLQASSLLPEAFTGLSIKEFKEISGDWEVKNYIPGKSLTLYKKINDLSPEDKEKIYLGEKDGKVAIFNGEPGSGYLRKMTDIEVNKLPYDEQKSLEQGLRVDSQEELFSILDGLISTINQD